MFSFKSQAATATRPTDASSGANSLLAKVARQADAYRAVVQQQGDHWIAYVPAFPDRFVEAATAEDAREKLHAQISGRLMGSLTDRAFSTPFAGNGASAGVEQDMERSLRRALSQQEFRLHYLPTVHLATGAIAGLEALIRWDHPARGLVSPGDFFSHAETAGLTASIDDWVLDEACRQIKAWQDRVPAGQSFMTSINVSQGQLRRPELAGHIIDVLRTNALDPSVLRVEVAESIIVEAQESVAQNLESLHSGGVRVTVDDVSAQHSSLAQLRRMTIDSLKIDRPLVSELPHGGTAAALVQAIVLLAHAWGLSVTAEGVETAEQAAALRELGCDYGQGFYFGHPVSSDDALRLIS